MTFFGDSAATRDYDSSLHQEDCTRDALQSAGATNCVGPSRLRDEILDVQIIVRSQQVSFTMDIVDLKLLIVCTPKLAQAKLKVKVAPCPVSTGPERKYNENINLMKIVAALAIGAAFPLGAIAAEPAKTTTQQGVIQKVERLRRRRRENIISRSLGWSPEAGPRFLQRRKRLRLTRLKLAKPQGMLDTGANWPCGSASSRRRLPHHLHEQTEAPPRQ